MIRTQLYHVRNYLKSSLWAVPFIAIPLTMAVTRLLHWFDAQLGWTLLGFGVSGAQAVLQATVTATLSFLVFTFGSMLVAIQVASGQLTPRIIATTLLRNNIVKYTVGLFVFTLLLALSVAGRIDTTVHQLPLFVAASLAVLCVAAFLYLIDYASRLLRPVTVLSHVGSDGHRVIESVYPDLSINPNRSESHRQSLETPKRIVQHRGTSGIVLAVDLKALAAEAERSIGVIEFVPQVGDFVARDEALFYLYGGAQAIDDNKLRSAVAFGSERTMEQDPTFAFRIIVDIALKALSPAINDPTTAVLAIDQLHRMLRLVGKRNLRTDEISDSTGQLRLIFRTPNWDDFVSLAFSEIRSYGSSNLQIVRRVRAMIENLMQTLPDYRHAALKRELNLLDLEVKRIYKYPEELELAYVADTQGLGGHSRKSPHKPD
jgi:uncharacterized membrane protein